MTIHIFTDDSDDEMLSMSSGYTVGSVHTGNSSSLNATTRATSTNKVAPLDAPWDKSRISSHTRAPSIGILSDAETSVEMGLGQQKETSSGDYREDSSKSMKIEKQRPTPDPVLGVGELPRMWKPRITAMIGCAAILLIGLIIAGLVIISQNHESTERNPTPSSINNVFNRGGETKDLGWGIPINISLSPSSAPSEPDVQWNTTQEPKEQKTRIEMLLEILVSESSRQDLTNSSTDQHAALKWLAEDDPADLNLDNTPPQDIKDRYKAALVYFSLSKGRGWRAMYGFLSAAPICEWNDSGEGYSLEGIRCENGQVVQLTLDMNHLQGTIPTEIALFDLQSLGLGSNRIGGMIPSQLGRLSNLTYLNLGSNNLVGTLPAELSGLVSIQSLFLYQNDLEGTIPFSYSALINLEYLFIEGTSLFGDVDAALCQRNNLFESFYANCAADGNITCTCCTSCCNSEGAACQRMVG